MLSPNTLPLHGAHTLPHTRSQLLPCTTTRFTCDSCLRRSNKPFRLEVPLWIRRRRRAEVVVVGCCRGTRRFIATTVRMFVSHRYVIAKLIHGNRKEWVTRHSQWKVLPHDDASSTGLSALFQLCWGLSMLGPYGPLRNGGSQSPSQTQPSVIASV